MPSGESHDSKQQSDSITGTILRILQEGSVAVVATLVEAANSATNVGAKLLVSDLSASRQTSGSLGDHALDRAVIEQAESLLDAKTDMRVFQVKEFAPALTDWSDAKILFERIQAEPRLVICGAGHVGASLAKLAGLIGYATILIDDREEFVTRQNFPETNIELVAAEDWSQAVATAVANGHGVSVAIVTRGHSEDEQCLRAVIPIDVDYIGLIGSKRRTNIVLRRLSDDGVDSARLQKVHAPIGLDIGAVTPEEVALAIMAEIVAARRGGKGGQLSAWRREKNAEASK
ncbi:MAG TPA: XdhC/CoxI family protein [Pyrinomonadaceae bacterium]|nr:XdhC/CoxI family protein [Pyrinomonadaceae bacterium]